MSTEPARFIPLPPRERMPPAPSPSEWAVSRKSALVGALLVLAIAGVVGIGMAVHRGNARARIAMIAKLAPEESVKVFGPAHDRGTLTVKMSLQLRGLEAEIVPVSSPFDLEATGLTRRLGENGMSAGRQVSLPIVAIGERLVANAEIDELLHALPVGSTREKEEPYVVVYGVQNCGYTAAAIKDLERASIPYELRDLNGDPGIGARAMSGMEASGYDRTSYVVPLIDVNGYVRPRLPIVEIVRRYHAR